MTNLKLQGFVLLDTDVAALNNAGRDTSGGYDNAVATKKIIKNGREHVYVSGQAWRYWWRQTLQKDCGWQMSPVLRGGKTAYTETNPVKYPDDDLFGYMRADTEDAKDEHGEIVMSGKGKKAKPKKDDITVTRVSPLKNSALISVASVRVAQKFSVMARFDGDPVPYAKDEYGAVLKGMFSLDLHQIGTFSTYNKAGYKNLTSAIQTLALENGGELISDENTFDSKSQPLKLVRLPKAVRLQRATDALQALKTLSGGAMQTNNFTDVTPKFILLATLQSGNHPFSHLVRGGGKYDSEVVFDREALGDALRDYAGQLVGKVFIGRRRGFLEEQFTDLAEWAKDFPNVQVGTVVEAVDGYCKELNAAAWMP